MLITTGTRVSSYLLYPVYFETFLLGELQASSLTAYCREGNLQLMLEQIPRLREDIGEALEVLEALDREDHRGMFSETDDTAWASTKFKSHPQILNMSTLKQIEEFLCSHYNIESSTWKGRVNRDSQRLDGVAIGRVIFSSKRLEKSVVFRERGSVFAGTVKKVFSHSHSHPSQGSSITLTYLIVEVLEPVPAEWDGYRKLSCGWLCWGNSDKQLETSSTHGPRITLVPVVNIISHFVRTDFTDRELTGTGNETPKAIIHVYPVPKVSLVYLSAAIFSSSE